MVPKQKPISAGFIPYERTIFSVLYFKKIFGRNTGDFRTGFTLVELLVVISIIGLLSSTVLAAVNSARVKADNTAKIRVIQEYKKALDFSYDTDGAYPSFQGASCGGASCNIICLGDYSSDECNWGSSVVSETAVVRQAVERYLPSRPVFKPVASGGTFRDGPMYYCTSIASSQCTPGNLYIWWYLTDPVLDCGFSITPFPGSASGLKTGSSCLLRIN